MDEKEKKCLFCKRILINNDKIPVCERCVMIIKSKGVSAGKLLALLAGTAGTAITVLKPILDAVYSNNDNDIESLESSIDFEDEDED